MNTAAGAAGENRQTISPNSARHHSSQAQYVSQQPAGDLTVSILNQNTLKNMGSIVESSFGGAQGAAKSNKIHIAVLGEDYGQSSNRIHGGKSSSPNPHNNQQAVGSPMRHS